MVVGVIQVLFTAMAAVIMDRAGRRLLLALSGEAQGLASALAGVCPRPGSPVQAGGSLWRPPRSARRRDASLRTGTRFNGSAHSGVLAADQACARGSPGHTGTLAMNPKKVPTRPQFTKGKLRALEGEWLGSLWSFGASGFTSLNLGFPCEMGVLVAHHEELGMVCVRPCTRADAHKHPVPLGKVGSSGVLPLSQLPPLRLGDPALGSLLEFVEV